MNLRHVLFVLAAALTTACAPPVKTHEIELVYGSPYSPNHPFSRADRIWMDHVVTASNGRIHIEPNWGGGLLSSEESMLEVRHGVVDIGLITPIYARGGAHLLRTQAGFYGGVKSYGDQLTVFDCLAQTSPQIAHETHGLRVLAIQGGNLPGLVTRTKPVQTLEDLKGMRIRAPVEILGVLSDLGVDPINLPMRDVYSAMAKGVIDGVVAPADTLQSLHFDEVAKYFTEVKFARGAYPARAMSQKVWDNLPADIQTILRESEIVWQNAMQTQITDADDRGRTFGKEQGIEFLDFDPDDQKNLDTIYNETALKAARNLRIADATAEPVFNLAQAVIKDLNETGTATCDAAPKGPPTE